MQRTQSSGFVFFIFSHCFSLFSIINPNTPPSVMTEKRNPHLFFFSNKFHLQLLHSADTRLFFWFAYNNIIIIVDVIIVISTTLNIAADDDDVAARWPDVYYHGFRFVVFLNVCFCSSFSTQKTGPTETEKKTATMHRSPQPPSNLHSQPLSHPLQQQQYNVFSHPTQLTADATVIVCCRRCAVDVCYVDESVVMVRCEWTTTRHDDVLEWLWSECLMLIVLFLLLLLFFFCYFVIKPHLIIK